MESAIIGVILTVILVLIACLCCCFCKKKKESPDLESQNGEPNQPSETPKSPAKIATLEIPSFLLSEIPKSNRLYPELPAEDFQQPHFVPQPPGEQREDKSIYTIPSEALYARPLHYISPKPAEFQSPDSGHEIYSIPEEIEPKPSVDEDRNTKPRNGFATPTTKDFSGKTQVIYTIPDPDNIPRFPKPRPIFSQSDIRGIEEADFDLLSVIGKCSLPQKAQHRHIYSGPGPLTPRQAQTISEKRKYDPYLKINTVFEQPRYWIRCEILNDEGDLDDRIVSSERVTAVQCVKVGNRFKCKVAGKMYAIFSIEGHLEAKESLKTCKRIAQNL